MVSSRSVSRLISAVIYLMMAASAVWAGSKLINYSLDSKYYKEYLIRWEVAIQALNTKNEPWPDLKGNDQIAYMEKVVRLMEKHQINIPRSNTKYPYLYQLKKIWGKTDEIFALCFKDRIFLFGISRKTLDRIDSYVDGVLDLSSGKLTGGMKDANGRYTGKLIL